MNYDIELENKVKQQLADLEGEMEMIRMSIGYEFDTHEINKLIKRLKEIDTVVFDIDRMMGPKIYPYYTFGTRLCKLHEDAQNMLTYFEKLNECCASTPVNV